MECFALVAVSSAKQVTRPATLCFTIDHRKRYTQNKSSAHHVGFRACQENLMIGWDDDIDIENSAAECFRKATDLDQCQSFPVTSFVFAPGE